MVGSSRAAVEASAVLAGTPSHHGVDSGAAQQLRGIYGALDAAIERIPPQGLLLRNR